MKQVLLSVASGNHRPLPPLTMWMTDDVTLGDVFLWKRRVCTVSAIYGTHLSCRGVEARKTERSHHHQQAGVVLDHHDQQPN